MRQTLQFLAKLSVVAILFAVLFSYAMFQGGFVSWFLFYAFLPFLIYMTGLLFYPIHNWNVERHLSKKVVMGGATVEVELTLTRKVPFPIYYCVIEEYLPESLKKEDTHFEKYRNMKETDAPFLSRNVKRVTFPWFRKTIRHHYELEKVPRGEHVLRAIRIKTGDFFGFVKKEQVYQLKNKFLVFPYQRPVKMKDGVYSFEQGASPSLKLNEKHTNVVTGVREYMPGDRFAWVDWKTTAKKNEMMTKEFEQEKSVDMLLVLNAVYHPSMNELSFEGSVELTASLLNEFYRKSSQLAFLSLGDGRRYFPFYQDHSHQQQLQGHLASIRPVSRIPFAQQLEREKSFIPSGAMVMVVSHYLDREVQMSLRKLAKKSKRTVFFYVCLHDQMTFQDHQSVKQLKNQGIIVNVLSEDQLTQQEFEVNT